MERNTRLRKLETVVAIGKLKLLPLFIKQDHLQKILVITWAISSFTKHFKH